VCVGRSVSQSFIHSLTIHPHPNHKTAAGRRRRRRPLVHPPAAPRLGWRCHFLPFPLPATASIPIHPLPFSWWGWGWEQPEHPGLCGGRGAPGSDPRHGEPGWDHHEGGVGGGELVQCLRLLRLFVCLFVICLFYLRGVGVAGGVVVDCFVLFSFDV
jgi:hypothetical protein